MGSGLLSGNQPNFGNPFGNFAFPQQNIQPLNPNNQNLTIPNSPFYNPYGGLGLGGQSMFANPQARA
jgi:hypothetical protein